MKLAFNTPKLIPFTLNVTLCALASTLVLLGCQLDSNSKNTHAENNKTEKIEKVATYEIEATNGAQLLNALSELLNNPHTPQGSVIKLPKGYFELLEPIRIGTTGIQLIGKGKGEPGKVDSGTVLDFTLQKDEQLGGSGSEGIQVIADAVRLEGFAVLNAVGDGIKAEGVKAFEIQNVRVEWLGEVNMDNGGYGIYPVKSKGVVIRDSFVRGASDAGIYVGQSYDILVENNLVVENVAGIEIENSQNAWVRNNTARGNTGGVLVFDLPDIQMGNAEDPGISGKRVRIENNLIDANNTRNFAARSNIVANTPPGTGLLIMASDQIEVVNNRISNHRSLGVAVTSYYLVKPESIKNPLLENYDGMPEMIYIHDNEFINNGYDPIEKDVVEGEEVTYVSGMLNLLFMSAENAMPDIAIGELGRPLNPLDYKMPDIVYGGLGEQLYQWNHKMPFSEQQKTCIQESAEVVIGEVYADGSLISDELKVPLPRPEYKSQRFNCKHNAILIDVGA
jgi:parallel beta-helix repeat protein